MVARAIGHGLLTPFRRPGLTFLLWAWGLLLVLAPAAAVSRWFEDALSLTMASDSMLQGIDLVVLGQIGQYNRTAVQPILATSMLVTLLVGALLGPLVAGGTLEVLTTTDDLRPFMHRFFRGAGHFYWRFLRLSVLAAAAAVVLLGALALGGSPLLTRASTSAWEPAAGVAAAVLAVVLGLVLVFCWLTLDYARIRVASDDSRSMLRALGAGAGFVFTHLAGALGIAAAFGAALLALFAIYLAWTASATFATAGAIALLFLVQQAVLVARHGLRLGQVDAQVAYWRACRPVVMDAVLPAPVEVASAEAAPVETPPDEAAPTEQVADLPFGPGVAAEAGGGEATGGEAAAAITVNPPDRGDAPPA